MAIIGPIVATISFLYHHPGAGALMVLFEMKSRQPVDLPAEGAARRKGPLDGSPRAALDGFRICLLFIFI